MTDDELRGLVAFAEALPEPKQDHQALRAIVNIIKALGTGTKQLLEERERRVFPIAQLRHLYAQMLNGDVQDTRQAAINLLGPAIERLEKP